MQDPREMRRKRNEKRSLELQDAFMERVRMAWLQREKDGLDGSELAARVGVHQTTVSGWLHKRYKPKLPPALMLAEALDVNPLWLLYGIGAASDGVEGPMEQRSAYYRGRMRQVLELQEYADQQMEALAALSSASPAADAQALADAAKPLAQPVPPPAPTASPHQERRGTANGDRPN